MTGKFLDGGGLLALAALIVSCGSCGSGDIQGGPRDFSEPGGASPEANGPGAASLPYEPSGDFPNKANTGVTEYWCPRWDELKTTTVDGFAMNVDGEAAEYRDVTNAGIEFNVNNAVLRCSKIQAQDEKKIRIDANKYGTLIESVRLASMPGASGGRHLEGGGDAFTWSRVSAWPTYRDVMQNRTGFIIDSYLDTYDNTDLSPSAHADVIQVSGGCGPHWYVHNTMRGDGARDYGDSCKNTPGQYCSNAVFFVKGKWGTSPCERTPSLVAANNFFDGGLRVSRWSDSSGRIINTAFYDNVWQSDTWYVNGGPCDHNWTGSGSDGTFSMVTNPDPSPSGSEICVEAEGNTQTNGDTAQITAECQFDTGEVFARGSCVDLEPIPVTTISNFQLGVTSCTQGQAACNDITLSANATTNEGPRSLDYSNPPGGSFRWRYSCGGTTAQTLSPDPCGAGHCLGGYQDSKADLWYDYPACNGLSSCTMTGVCDYDAEAQGAYTAKIYAEAGPGAGYRPSGHDEATFTVN